MHQSPRNCALFWSLACLIFWVLFLLAYGVVLMIVHEASAAEVAVFMLAFIGVTLACTCLGLAVQREHLQSTRQYNVWLRDQREAAASASSSSEETASGSASVSV